MVNTFTYLNSSWGASSRTQTFDMATKTSEVNSSENIAEDATKGLFTAP